MSFQIGDIVKITDRSSFACGCVGEIVEERSNNLFIVRTSENDKKTLCEDYHLEMVKPKNIKEKNSPAPDFYGSINFDAIPELFTGSEVIEEQEDCVVTAHDTLAEVLEMPTPIPLKLRKDGWIKTFWHRIKTLVCGG